MNVNDTHHCEWLVTIASENVFEVAFFYLSCESFN